MSLRQWSQRGDYAIKLVAMSPRLHFVLVEGHSDYKFLSNCICDALPVVPVEHKQELVRTCRRLDEKGVGNYLALADADFDAVIGRNADLPRLIYVSLSETDADSCLDLESAILRTPALRKVVVELLGPHIQSLGGPSEFEKNLREWARSTAMQVGAYRAALMAAFQRGDRIRGIGDLSDQQWSSFINFADGLVSHAALDSLMETTIHPPRFLPALKASANGFIANYGDGWLLCRGHDMTHLLALRLTSLSHRNISRHEVESKLRLAFESAMLDDLAFGRHVRHFEKCMARKQV